MEYSIIENSPQQKTIYIKGQFTFSDSGTFRQLLGLLEDKKLQSITLDFTHVTFVDSSALGMLLLMREECELRHMRFTLSHPQGQVEKIFLISRFDKLFTIQH